MTENITVVYKAFWIILKSLIIPFFVSFLIYFITIKSTQLQKKTKKGYTKIKREYQKTY